MKKMSCVVFLILFTFSCLILQGSDEKINFYSYLGYSVFTQPESSEENIQDTEEKSKEDRIIEYNKKKKNPMTAVLYSFIPIVPVGHIYAENVNRGIVFSVLEALGIVLIATVDYRVKLMDVGTTSIVFTPGTAIFIVAMVWKAYDASQAVEKYNEKLKQKLRLGFILKKDKFGIGIGYSF